MKQIWVMAAVFLAGAATPALAWDTSFTGKVTMIEPSYVPVQVVFQSDHGVGTCAAGSMLSWTARGATSADKIANAQAILAMLQTTKATGGNVDIYVTTSNCSVEFLHFL